MLETSIAFQILALIILMLLHTMFRIYRKIFLMRERVFFIMLNLATFCVSLDIFHRVAIQMRDILPDTAIIMMARAYLLSIVLFSSCLLLYTLSEIFQSELLADKRRYLYFLIDAMAFPILLNLDLRYEIDEYGVGVNGPALIATFIMNIMYLAMSMIIMIARSKSISLIRRQAIVISCLAICIASVFQMRYHNLHVLSAVISIILIYIYFCLEPPGEYLDGVLGVFNNEAYQMYLRNRISNKKSVSLLYIRITDYSKIMEVFGSGFRNIFLKNLCEYLSSFETAKTFYIGNGELLLAFEEPAFFIKNFQEIKKRISQTWNVAESDEDVVEIEVNAVVIAYPAERMEDDLTLENVTSTFDYYISKYRTASSNEFLCIDRKELREKERYDHVVRSLENAIEENRVGVYFQSIYSVEEDRTIGIEALMRVVDERGIYLDNDMVINYAERSGQIRRLGNEVLKKICSFVRTHSLYELEIYTINVNLSVMQCQDSRMASDFIEIMESYQLPASMFRFEIVSALTSYVSVNFKKNVERLTEIGAEFIVDDFGKDRANIENMLQLNFKTVKLSPKTVRDYFANARVRNSVRIDCQLLRQMNVTVMAVGVENQQQYNELKKLGIEYMQGVAFYKPMDGIAMIKAISKERDNGIERETLYERIL